MAKDFNGSSDYLSVAATTLTNEPIDFVIYGKSDSATANQVALGLGDGGAALGQWAMAFRGDVASDPVRILKLGDASGSTSADSIGYTTGTWMCASGSFRSDTDRSVYTNGGTEGTGTTNVTDPTPNYISVGALRRSTVANYFDGAIAEVYVLDAGMTDDQHSLAGAGISPIWFMPLANIRAWYPLQGDNNNRVGNGYPDLTASGSPADSAHPANVILPRINGVIMT